MPLPQVSKAPPGVRGCQRLLPQSGREESREPRTTWSSSRKRRRSQSRRRDSRPTVPFPLQDHKGRLQALRMLYEEATGNRLASEMTALRGLREGHPEMGAEELQRLNNQVLLMIAEYHLTSASQGTHHILPVLLEGAIRLMPPPDEYLPGRSMVAATLESDRARSCVSPSGCTAWISTPRMAQRSLPHPGWRTTISGPSWNIF